MDDAQEALKVYPHLSAEERVKLCGFAKVEGSSGPAVFKHFGAHRTGTKHRWWMVANSSLVGWGLK